MSIPILGTLAPGGLATVPIVSGVVSFQSFTSVQLTSGFAAAVSAGTVAYNSDLGALVESDGVSTWGQLGSGGGLTAPAFANFGAFPDPSTVPETFAYATDTNRVWTAQSVGHGSFSWIAVTPSAAPIFTVTGIKTSSYNANYWETVRSDTSAGGFPVNVPTAATAGLQIKQKLITGGGALVLTPAPGETIDLASTNTDLRNSGDSMILEADGGTNWMVF